MAANNQTSESISIGPQFQTPYVLPMPYSRTPGSLFFEEVNISKFWKMFKNMCNDYQMSTSEKI